MAISAEEILFLLSGGTSNTKPENSIGGEPSFQPVISGLINNLFNDVSEEENTAGLTDYRCFYVVNDNNDGDTLFDSQIFITEQVDGGSNLAIGTIVQNEVQRITINGKVRKGYFTISFENYALNINHPGEATADTDVAKFWASEFQNKLRTLEILSDVTVTGTSSADFESVFFEINFRGRDGKRSQDLIQVIGITNLVPENDVTVNTSSIRVIPGSPINAISPLINSVTTSPSGVNFGFPTIDSPLLVGDLRVSDSFFVWAKRETTANTPGQQDDGVTLGLKGGIIPARNVYFDGQEVVFPVEDIELDFSTSFLLLVDTLSSNETFIDVLPQSAGSIGVPGLTTGLSSTVSGTITAFITQNTIEFSQANLNIAISGKWAPNLSLVATEADASAGLYFSSPDGNVATAIRNINLSFSMPQQYLSGFDFVERTFVLTQQVYEINEGVVYTKNLNGALVDENIVDATGTIAANSSYLGTLRVVGIDDLRLSIPITLSFAVSIGNENALYFGVTGTIEAKVVASIPLPYVPPFQVQRFSATEGIEIVGGSTINYATYKYLSSDGLEINGSYAIAFSNETTAELLIWGNAVPNPSIELHYSNSSDGSMLELDGSYAISFSTEGDFGIQILGNALPNPSIQLHYSNSSEDALIEIGGDYILSFAYDAGGSIEATGNILIVDASFPIDFQILDNGGEINLTGEIDTLRTNKFLASAQEGLELIGNSPTESTNYHYSSSSDAIQIDGESDVYLLL